jgi:hypothetical protein
MYNWQRKSQNKKSTQTRILRRDRKAQVLRRSDDEERRRKTTTPTPTPTPTQEEEEKRDLLHGEKKIGAQRDRNGQEDRLAIFFFFREWYSFAPMAPNDKASVTKEQNDRHRKVCLLSPLPPFRFILTFLLFLRFRSGPICVCVYGRSCAFFYAVPIDPESLLEFLFFCSFRSDFPSRFPLCLIDTCSCWKAL